MLSDMKFQKAHIPLKLVVFFDLLVDFFRFHFFSKFHIPITRKACTSHPNPSTEDVKDILDLMDRKTTIIELPTFVAQGHTSFPPSNFEIIAPVIMTLRDEVSHLRIELSELRKATEKDQKSFETVSTVKQDVADIKKTLHSLRTRNMLREHVNFLGTHYIRCLLSKSI